MNKKEKSEVTEKPLTENGVDAIGLKAKNTEKHYRQEQGRLSTEIIALEEHVNKLKDQLKAVNTIINTCVELTKE